MIEITTVEKTPSQPNLGHPNDPGDQNIESRPTRDPSAGKYVELCYIDIIVGVGTPSRYITYLSGARLRNEEQTFLLH